MKTGMAKEWAVVKTEFNDGTTSYNLNRVQRPGKSAIDFIDRATRHINLDIKAGKNLTVIQQFIIDRDMFSCEVIRRFSDITSAKQLVNLEMELDPNCIRTKKFNI